MAQSNNPLLNETSQLEVTTLTESLGNKHPMSSPKLLGGNQGLTWQFLVPLGAQSLSILDPTIFSSKNSELDFSNNLFKDSPFFSEYRTATPKYNATKQVSPVVTSSSTATNISNTQSELPSSIIQPKQEIFTTNIEKIPELASASLSGSKIEGSNINASIASDGEGVSVQLKPEVANSKFPQITSVNDVAIPFNQFDSIEPASSKSSSIPETITSQVNRTTIPEKELSSLAAFTFTSDSIFAQTAFVNSETPVKPVSDVNETIAESRIIQPAIEVENHSINNVTSVQRAIQFSKEQNTGSESEIILTNPHVEMRSHSSVPNLQESLPASEKLTVTNTTKPEVPDTQATELPELFATANAQSTQENQNFAVSTQAIISSSVASDIPIQRKSIETKTPTLSSVTTAQDSQLTQINQPTNEIVSSIAATSVQRQEENNQTSSVHSKLTTDLSKADSLVLSPMQAIAPVTSLIPIQPKTDFNSLLEADQKRELSESKSSVSQAMNLTQPKNFDCAHRPTEHTHKKQDNVIGQDSIPQVSQSLLVNQTPTLQPHTETTALALPVETATNIIEAVAHGEHFVNAKSALSIFEQAPQVNNQISDTAPIVNSSVGNQTSIIQTQTSTADTLTKNSQSQTLPQLPQVLQNITVLDSLAANQSLRQPIASNIPPPINSPKSDRSQSVTTVSASNVSSWSDIRNSAKKQTTLVQRKLDTQNSSSVNTVIQAGANQPEAIRLSNQQGVSTTEESNSEVSQSIETLAQAIYEKVRYRLRIQQERHGRGYTGRLSW